MHDFFQLFQAIGTNRGLVIDEFINDRTSLEEIADDLRCGKVVVHGIVALLTQGFHHLLSLGIALVADLYTL